MFVNHPSESYGILFMKFASFQPYICLQKYIFVLEKYSRKLFPRNILIIFDE